MDFFSCCSTNTFLSYGRVFDQIKTQRRIKWFTERMLTCYMIALAWSGFTWKTCFIFHRESEHSPGPDSDSTSLDRVENVTCWKTATNLSSFRLGSNELRLEDRHGDGSDWRTVLFDEASSDHTLTRFKPRRLRLCVRFEHPYLALALQFSISSFKKWSWFNRITSVSERVPRSILKSHYGISVGREWLDLPHCLCHLYLDCGKQKHSFILAFFSHFMNTRRAQAEPLYWSVRWGSFSNHKTKQKT